MKVCPKCGSWKLTLLQRLYSGTVYGAECDVCGGFSHYDKLVEDEQFRKALKIE